jgi:hypothetical protein
VAYLIPDNLRSREDVPSVLRRVATALKLGLDDDAIAWFEPVWDASGEKPHFVVFLPENGIAVAEVLDVQASKLFGALRGRIRLERDGVEIEAEHPLVRATRYAETLRQRIAAEPRFGSAVSVTPIALFPALERHVAIERGFSRLDGLDLARCLFKEDIETAVAGDGVDLHRAFARMLGAGNTTNEGLVDLVRAVIQPDIVISGAGWEGQLSILTAPRGKELIHVMDRKQEALAKSIGDGHRVVRGVAGSGKTLILVYRARLMAALYPNHRFLLVCYNRSLASELGALLADLGNVSVEPAHVLIGQAIRDANLADPGFDDDSGEERAQAGLEALEKGALVRYRAVFLDEAQDLGPKALRFVVSLADDRFNDVLIVADAAQNVFHREFSWKQAGIQAQGRSKILRRNYRNTREVLELAHGFLVPEGAGEASLDFEDESVIIPPESAMRTGAPATVVICDETELTALAFAEIIRMLPARPAPKSLAVLTMSNREGIELERRLRKSGLEHYFVSDPQKPQNKDHVADTTAPIILSTVYSTKGMEFPDVVLCCSPRTRQETEGLRRLMYVGMTRASERLVVFAGTNHPLADDLEAAAAQRGRLRVETDTTAAGD